MMNIEQITSRLAQMPDQALQQYAMMHKDDPYIMALAVSESRRRKQMRAAAVPQPQAQPKVADQALMEMAPAGVASLPTQDMNFAGGGIVAFADGGDVERYQAGGTMYETPYDRMNRLNREQEERDRQERLARIEAEGGVTTPYSEQMRNVGQFFDQFVPDPRNIFKTLVSAPGYGLNKSAAPVTPAAAAAYDPNTATRAADYRTQAAPGTGTTPAGGGLAATPEAAALRQGAGAGAASVTGAKNIAGQFLDTKSMQDKIDQYIAEEKAGVEEGRKKLMEGKPGGKAYSKFEEMLQAEEAGAAKEKDEATGVAIFKAGLAMMAGTSPRAFENIGKGAMAGLDEYSGAMKDIKKAAKERQKAFADIENARRAEERDDWKVARDYEDKAQTRLSKAKEFGVKGIMDVTGKSADIASKIYDRQVAEAGSTQRTQISAAAMQARGLPLESKEVAAAEAAFARDPQARALMKTLETFALNPSHPAAIRASNQLKEIQAAKYKQFGLTLEGAPGAPGPGGTTRMRFDAQGNLIQ